MGTSAYIRKVVIEIEPQGVDDMKVKKLFAVITTFALFTGQVRAATTDDTLEFFQEEAKVVTASRYEQPISESSMAITVITAEDIEASGAVNLWDIMRFSPGMDISEGRAPQGNRAIVSVRGFPKFFVDSLQVLVDGRSVYTPVDSGVLWQELPVQLEDIDHIEIARGPNAALYGSNAAQGTINIITRRPDQNVLAARSRAGNLNLRRESASAERASDKAGFRVSQTYLRHDGFDAPSGADGHEFVNSNVASLRGFWKPAAGTDAEIMAGGAWNQMGRAGYPDTRLDTRDRFAMAKISQDIGSTTADLMVASKRELRDVATQHSLLDQNDVEVQHRLGWWNNRVHTTWGGSFRNAKVRDAELFVGSPNQRNITWRGFTDQTIKLLNRLTLRGAVSFEDSDTGGQLSAYQVATLYRLAPHQMVRMSYSMAPTLPGIFFQHANFQPSPLVRVTGNPTLDATKVRSVELGYRGFFDQRRLEMDTNVFYSVTSNIKVEETRAIFFPTFRLDTTFRNNNRILSRGSEMAVKYHFGAYRSVYANYTYQTLSDDKGLLTVTRAVPEHKFNVGGAARLWRGLNASVNAGYKDGYLSTGFNSNTIPISSYWRVDARVGYKIGTGEIFLAGQNLTRPQHIEAVDGLAVSRTYQAGVSLQLGGSK